MTIREQLEILYGLRVEFVVVGGQAGVLRQAVEFSHDLDILGLRTDCLELPGRGARRGVGITSRAGA